MCAPLLRRLFAGMQSLHMWADCTDFGDDVDTTNVIASLKNTAKIIEELLKNMSDRFKDGSAIIYSMPPGSWSNESYYVNTVGSYSSFES